MRESSPHSKDTNDGKRRRAENELALLREWQRVTLRSIGDAVIAKDDAGRVTFLNPVAEELTGWKPLKATVLPLENVFRIVNEETRQLLGRLDAP